MARYEPGPILDRRKFRSVLLDTAAQQTFDKYLDKGLIGNHGGNKFLPRMAATNRKIAIGPTPSGKLRPANIPKTQANFKGTKDVDMSGVSNAASAIAPFVSNIANSFRKPPSPVAPILAAPISLRKPSLAVGRREVDRAVKGANTSADLALDQNTAAAAKAANLITGINAKGKLFEEEANMGAQVDNQAASINANINMANLRRLDQYNDDKVNRGIAIQREGSENIANAADKFVQIQARKDAMDLERQKFATVSQAFAQSGVTQRLVNRILGKDADYKPTQDEIDEALFSSSKKFANGGRIGGTIAHMPRMNRSRRLRKLF